MRKWRKLKKVARAEKEIPYFGKFADNTLAAYSFKYFWKVEASDSKGGPVLSCEHCTKHFL